MPWHTFLPSHWLSCQEDHFLIIPIGHQSTWLFYNFIQLISIPGMGLTLHAFVTSKITCYTAKTLLDFVEICFTIHCYTISGFSLYFHVHILCTLCQT